MENANRFQIARVHEPAANHCGSSPDRRFLGAFSLAGCVAAFASEAVDAKEDVSFGLMLQTYAYCGDSLSLASTLRRWPLGSLFLL